MNTLFIISFVLGCFLVTINGKVIKKTTKRPIIKVTSWPSNNQRTAEVRCPSCTYLTTTADIPFAARTVIDEVLGLFQDAECSHNSTSGPIPGVREETCPVESGIISKCSFYNGSLTLRVPIIDTEIPFQMYQRGCFSTSSDNVPVNGCYDRDNVNEDNGYFQKILDSAGDDVSSLDAVNFKGNLCVSSSSAAHVAVKWLFISSFLTLIVLRLL